MAAKLNIQNKQALLLAGISNLKPGGADAGITQKILQPGIKFVFYY